MCFFLRREGAEGLRWGSRTAREETRSHGRNVQPQDALQARGTRRPDRAPARLRKKINPGPLFRSRALFLLKQVLARANAADPRLSHADLSNTAPSALARILLTSESSFLDQLANEASADDGPATGKSAKGKAVGALASTPSSAASSPAALPKKAAAAPPPAAPAATAAAPAAPAAPAAASSSSTAGAPASTASSAAQQPGHGVLHSRTMDEDWFRNVHHSILSSGGDLRTSALSLFLPPTLENMESPTAETAASAAAAAAAASMSAGMSGSPKDSGIDDMSSRTSPHDSPERIERRSSEHPPSERRIQRESSGLSSQGNRFYNSCWTIYVDSTVVKPNLESTLRWYALKTERERNWAPACGTGRGRKNTQKAQKQRKRHKNKEKGTKDGCLRCAHPPAPAVDRSARRM